MMNRGNRDGYSLLVNHRDRYTGRSRACVSPSRRPGDDNHPAFGGKGTRTGEPSGPEDRKPQGSPTDIPPRLPEVFDRRKVSARRASARGRRGRDRPESRSAVGDRPTRGGPRSGPPLKTWRKFSSGGTGEASCGLVAGRVITRLACLRREAAQLGEGVPVAGARPGTDDGRH